MEQSQNIQQQNHLQQMEAIYEREMNAGSMRFQQNNADVSLTHLSRQNTFERIEKLLQNGKRVICNLHDRDGLIGLEIITIYNDFESEICILTFKNDEKFKVNIDIIKSNSALAADIAVAAAKK
jgi:hypothetical protein